MLNTSCLRCKQISVKSSAYTPNSFISSGACTTATKCDLLPISIPAHDELIMSICIFFFSIFIFLDGLKNGSKRMYIWTVNYSERGSRLRRDHHWNYHQVPALHRDFLHSNQNDARAFYAPMLKRVFQWAVANLSRCRAAFVSRRNYFLAEKWGMAHNVFGYCRRRGFLAQKFNRRTALEPTTKLSYEALHPPFRQAAVVRSPFCLSIIGDLHFNCST